MNKPVLKLSKSYQQGLSMIELLAALAIFVLLLIGLTQGVLGGSASVSTMLWQGELVEDQRVASAIIANRSANAVYVYVPGIDIELAYDVSTLNPATNDSQWQVGRDPFLAFIESPLNKLLSCSSSTPEACLVFVAYYAIRRDRLVLDSQYHYLKDDSNNNKWVLMEYEQRLNLSYDDLLDANNIPIDSQVLQAKGNILVDYLDPSSDFNLTLNWCQNIDGSLNDGDGDSNPDCLALPTTPHPYLTVVSGNLSFKNSLVRRGKTITLGSISTPISPRGLYNALLNP
ncbi:MAG: prepilin-type N-terminal cleavage/methylation domain-containing protein [Deinococcales bacterium]